MEFNTASKNGHSGTGRRYLFDGFEVDPANRRLLRDGEAVPLAAKVFDVLVAFAENPGRLLEKDELLEKVWPGDFVEEGNLARNISTLRKALGDTGKQHKYIITVQGWGYRFAADVARADGTAATAATEGGASQVSRAEGGSPAIYVKGISKNWLWAIPLIVLLVAAVWAGKERFFPTFDNRIRSLAVLPLDNLSGDSSQDYLAEGLTDSLITEFSKISDLRVISRTSSSQFKGKNMPIAEIARQLNVDAIVEGSVTRSGGRLLITTQLIRAADDRHLWAEIYERDIGDVLSMQREVTTAIAGALNLKLSQKEQRPAAVAFTDPKAQDAYLKGIYYFHEGQNAPSEAGRKAHFIKALELLQQAIDLQPGYASAYAKYAGTCHWLASGGTESGYYYTKGKEAALKAIELDETDAEGHGALAFIVSAQGNDRSRAEAEYKRAIDLNPNTDYRHGYALFLAMTGQLDEAMHEIELAEQIDPRLIATWINGGGIYRQAGRLDIAIEQYKNAVEFSPESSVAHQQLGITYVLQGNFDAGIREIRKAGEISPAVDSRDVLGWAFAVAGKRDEAFKLADEILKSPETDPPLMIYSGLGENDKVLSGLEDIYSKTPNVLSGLRMQPAFFNLKNEPRFQELLRKLDSGSY
ncbi:MAG: winged helix-turn-helix domain-containing protein [Acidobacteriota bacterium]